MSSIDRVDVLVRKNIIKYTEQKNQELYQQQIHQYEKQRKKDALKSYAQIIKGGNRKAVQKMKEKQKKAKKGKRKTINIQPNIENTEDNGQNKKNKLNQNQIKRIQSAIQTRAQRILQQKQLQKLDKQLAQEKKKTKLYQLNQRCRKLAKSSVKIPTTISIMPEQRRKILQQFERKAMEEVQQLDNVINNILSGPKSQSLKDIGKLNPTKQKKFIQHKQKQFQKDNKSQNEINILNPDLLELSLFTKSPEQLLSLQYIPL